ncbi:hypothetical protein BMS3Bbin02_01059 [bacterium BMS3Bbin02]|nr:hypothetical protein BMS3Bbin02_01059 [bacterium BMS3Bbin02]
MRVDDQAGPGLTGQAEPSRLVERLLFAAAALLVVLAGYFFATACWDGRWYPGCRVERAGNGTDLILLAQIVGFIGFVKMRRVSRQIQDRTSSQSLEGEPKPAVMNHFQFWLTLVSVVLLVAAGMASYLWGGLTVSISCWNSQTCPIDRTLYGALVLAVGVGLVFAAFLVAGRAFRRRPWRRNTPPEPLT